MANFSIWTYHEIGETEQKTVQPVTGIYFVCSETSFKFWNYITPKEEHSLGLDLEHPNIVEVALVASFNVRRNSATSLKHPWNLQ